ncbi:unnamed protein product [Gongylonema pulchrum]|uniref:Coatomer_g_Cpla domain-containing protein n=1 Tax=Gongylonema pulchrum TaxID=637853 RepID=A0A183DUF2_9BILA|nr:unnamed protein product [Gongylonema pulchrum]
MIDNFGMAPCERTDRVPEGKSAHTLLLSGIYRGGYEFLAKIRFVLDPVDKTVTMNLLLRRELYKGYL